MKIFFSNRVENLFECLKQDLYSSTSSPFSNRLVVVPSPAVKTWLSQQIAENFNIAMGVQVSYLEQTLASFRRPEKTEVPSSLSLSLAIEEEVRRAHADRDSSAVWEPLWRYLDAQEAKRFSKKGERRLISLAETLAPFFQQYGIYGAELIEGWERGRPETDGWQAALWREIFCRGKYPWSYPLREYAQEALFPKKETALFLFSMSYLSKIHHQFLERLSRKLPVRYYLLSPCEEFWSDILSDGESGRLQAYWKRRGINEVEEQSLEEYLSDRNPLLANYGRVGREMAKTLEEGDIETESFYQVKREGPFSLLEAVQADLVEMRNPASEERREIDENDSSIQVHSASSHLREVEIVRDRIFEMIETKGLHPEEIIVMAPHIGEYSSFIRYVFEESGIDYQLMDLATPLHQSAIQAFLMLIDLPFTRWDVVSILQLFENRSFRDKLRLSLDDLEEITEWLRDTGVHWGEDADHREEILQRDHGTVSLVEKSARGTWDDAIGQLLTGLAKTENERDLIFSSQGELLGKLIDLLRGLGRDLKPFQSGAIKSLDSWVELLKGLAEKYLELDEQSESLLVNQLDKFLSFPREMHVAFPSIRKRLKEQLKKEQSGYRENHLHAVRFCSMLPMRAIPAKGIILMGMQEGSFPKKDINLSLNQCLQHPDKVEFCPTVADYDRFLFLEAILSARDYLLFTFQGISREEGKEQPPNTLVNELLHYLKKAYGKELAIQKHTQFAFSQERHYEHLDYGEAVAYYEEEKKPAHRFLSGYIGDGEERQVIDLKDLVYLAKNPFRTYLNHTFQLYFRSEEELPAPEDKFKLTELDMHLLRREALEHSMEEVWELAEKRGMLPQGLLKEVEKRGAKKEVGLVEQPERLFSLTLSEDCREPEVDEEGNWTVPPIETEGGYQVAGKLSEVGSEGLFVLLKSDKENCLRAWPQYLVFHEAIRRYGLPINLDVHFARDGAIRKPFFEDGSERLSHLCDFYERAKREASPLLHSWVHPLIYEDEKKLQKKIEETKLTYDPYFSWLFRRGGLPRAVDLKRDWEETARILYGDLFTNWSKK